ncbi:MAG: DUF760 domain-containing protein [Pseudanabaenaceae cyanobacterium bins.68]|nr:DUF760 domain-containing protein [Pseudanabaenaceae cyanobacterium bins.68]
MFNVDDLNASDNPLLSYLKNQPPEVLSELAQSASPEVKQIIAHNVQSLLGVLPPRQFNVEITTNHENLAGLIGSAMMTGYFLKQMELRMSLDQSLGAVGSLDS